MMTPNGDRSLVGAWSVWTCRESPVCSFAGELGAW
jgi:hypothetical protein